MTLWPLAFIAGIVSFSSPCALPLLPGYLGHVSGLVERDDVRLARSRAIGGALLFVAGFSAVFAALGASVGLVGSLLLSQKLLLTQAAGVLILGMALLQVTGWRPAFFAAMALGPATGRRGLGWSFALGMAFAASWTPCIGPVLAAILLTATAEGSALEGGALLLVYSFGLGVPFLASALAMQRIARLRDLLMRRHRAVEIVGGGVLATMGLLMISDRWLLLMAPLLRWYARLGWPPL
ncbi:MAG: cytochrome c biogenesis CcdA family protein [Candidatus Limnocylindria bacterium]